MKDLEFLEELFQRLDDNGIAYAILRKAEILPSGVFNDIDWVVDNCKMEEFNRILIETCKKCNWQIDMRIQKNGFEAIRLHSVGDHTPLLLHFDLFDTFMWQSIKICSNEELLHGRIKKGKFYSVSIILEAMIELLTRLLFNGYVKVEYRNNIHEVFEKFTSCVLAKLSDIFGKNSGVFIVNSVLAQNWEAIEGAVDDIRKEAHFNKKKKNIMLFLLDEISYKVYSVKRIVHKPGIMVVFEGTDGSGKSTIIDSMPNIMYRSYDSSYIDYYHWRPGVIKREKKEKDRNNIIVSDPHALKPYGRIKSFFKFCFFNIDYLVGYIVKIRWQLAKGHIVVFDRYYYDYYLDKIRYRLSISNRVIDVFKSIIPKPGITFLLIGDPEVLYERKREISIKEIEAQIRRLMGNMGKFNNPCIVDVNNPIDIVCGDVCNQILMKLAEKSEGK